MLRNLEAEKVHIAVLGKQNVGKSKLINSIFGQELCTVDDKPGTTLDSVRNAVELSPFGPVIVIDTAGIDSEGGIRTKKINKIIKTISTADFAVLVLDAREELDKSETDLITSLRKIQVPFIVAVNKIEFGINPNLLTELQALEVKHFEISCKENAGIDNLKKKLIHLLPVESGNKFIKEFVNKGDVVILVVPDDFTLSQNSVLKSHVESVQKAIARNAVCMVLKKHDLSHTLSQLKNPPDFVIADDDIIAQVENDLPPKVKLTTYSLILAKNKANLADFVTTLQRIGELHDGDKLLISEACETHHLRYDVGKLRVKELLKHQTKKNIKVDFTNGSGLPDNISDYKLIIHCNGCMLSKKELQSRLRQAALMDIPVINYSVFISYMNGNLPRLISPFNAAASTLAYAN
jgi:[FeFe] hydrogenase H-cluster maturation GTPase HydF